MPQQCGQLAAEEGQERGPTARNSLNVILRKAQYAQKLEKDLENGGHHHDHAKKEDLKGPTYHIVYHENAIGARLMSGTSQQTHGISTTRRQAGRTVLYGTYLSCYVSNRVAYDTAPGIRFLRGEAALSTRMLGGGWKFFFPYATRFVLFSPRLERSREYQ